MPTRVQKKALHHNSTTNNEQYNYHRIQHEKSPERTIVRALDMSKAFGTVHLHQFLHKITPTSIPNTIIKCISIYIRGRKKYTLYYNTKSKQEQSKQDLAMKSTFTYTVQFIHLWHLNTTKRQSKPSHICWRHHYYFSVTRTSTKWNSKCIRICKTYTSELYKAT